MPLDQASLPIAAGKSRTRSKRRTNRVHRSIVIGNRPEIKVRRDGTVKVWDFGLRADQSMESMGFTAP